ncbi:unnamed protein product [Pleuronectes platessa]|uniref:Uncharacterized protein n=1 Tax=Pleuronectes platessa TaxID=8262 RepID=A0A9N7V5Q8_PLEPL|nr:unnamed protein product [Pleuronectes platessa]
MGWGPCDHAPCCLSLSSTNKRHFPSCNFQSCSLLCSPPHWHGFKCLERVLVFHRHLPRRRHCTASLLFPT